MSVLRKYHTVNIVLLICTLLAIATPALAGQKGLSVELNARIMEIDLGNQKMIVGEKDILLLARLDNGDRKWQTVFVDAKGHTISPVTLKQRDRVLVKGEDDGAGKISAREIRKIAE
ncbi:MAG: hypothetical protein KKB30_10050 [Proteobacteria bacterium]|nr:hypothetical protein [Pseudomonadota bacterium]MBU1716392.1 hypothetical protein [Pseudomonadota bacterium]